MADTIPFSPPPGKKQTKIVSYVTINVEEDGKLHIVGPSMHGGGIDYLACLDILSKGLDVIGQLLRSQIEVASQKCDG